MLVTSFGGMCWYRVVMDICDQPMSSMTAGWLLSGASSQWKGAKPGKVFESLVDGRYANPVIVIDEIDKAASDAQYDPLGSLYSLLEHDTARGAHLDLRTGRDHQRGQGVGFSQQISALCLMVDIKRR